ncbi:MAG: EamA family transporter [Spirochaetia bacterium]|nr:EamA family transporter [Spirochaetia bacterium]MBO7517438.1 EamA family transporter [Spirochaetia bacterium]MBP5739609.1 EamA family transporter [Spirochaetia bacterium]
MNLTIFVLTLISGILNATWNFFSKKKAGDYSVMVTGLALSHLTILPVTLVLISIEGLDIHAVPVILLSGFFAGLNTLLLVFMYESSDISMAYPVTRGTGVMFIAILSSIFLGEQISRLAIVGISLVLLGVFLFALTRGRKLSDIWESIKRQKIAFFTGLSMVGYNLVDRVAVQNVNPLFLYNLRGIVAMSFAIGFLMLKRGYTLSHMRDTFRHEWKYSCIIGYGGFIGYAIILMIYYLFAEAKASYITPIRETSIVIGAILGFLFLKEKATLNKLAGILAIVLGVILIKVG